MTERITNTFFKLLQMSVGKSVDDFPADLSLDEWNQIFLLSRKQSLVGVVLDGVEKLPSDLCPNSPMLRKVFAYVESIRKKNINELRALEKTLSIYEDAGFGRVVLLKGLGLASLYPDPFLRMPGDIDLWIDAPRSSVIEFCRRGAHCSEVSYHHVDAPKVDGIEVEAHFIPSWMHDPVLNHRLMKWFEEQKAVQFSQKTDIGGVKVCVPDNAFNRVYVLLHIYRHLFREGIGLRQIMDYYYVLKQGFSEEERVQTMKVIEMLRMKRFCSAVMYVLQSVFGLESDYLLCEADENDGRFLLNEIMLSGNFGQYDSRYTFSSNPFKRFMQIVCKNIRFVLKYPSEVIWTPGFKIWHWFWRRKYNS